MFFRASLTRRLHSREIIRTIVADQRPSLRILRLCRLDVLVGNIHLLFQGIQLRVLKYFPPIASKAQLVRLGSFPIACFFISRRNFGWRAVVFGAHCTAGKKEHAGDTDDHHALNAGPKMSFRVAQKGHSAPPAAAAVCTTCTFCPFTMESGGLTMTDSSPLRPETISISSPKSRPGVTGVSATLPLLTTANCRPCERNIRVETGTK